MSCNKPETFLPGEDYHGADLIKGGLKTSSGADCCNMCKQNPKCKYWTYGTGAPRKGICWLKKNTSGHEKQKGRMSGRVCRKKPEPNKPGNYTYVDAHVYTYVCAHAQAHICAQRKHTSVHIYLSAHLYTHF